MKHTKKIAAVLLAAMLIAIMMPASAFASGDNTLKEEVVYINLNADGSAKEINVVNIFELDSAGQIKDFGKYESVRNMTTSDSIEISGDTVTINAGAGKLYYEGRLESKNIPWNIDVRYYMNSKEFSAKEIAGKSGSLKIKMKITENKECAGNFYESYALQAVFTLDTKKCRNILAEGATAANVGSNKQLTYTVLPGKGAEIEITADVTDFEMNAIAVNAVRLNLNIELDKSKLKNKIEEIISAANAIDEGAEKLSSASREICGGTALLNSKVGELYTGVESLGEASAKLAGGLSALTAKNDELINAAYTAFKGLCTASETIVNAQLAENGLPGVQLSPENYRAVLKGILANLSADSVYTNAYNRALAEVTAQVEAGADALYEGYVEQNAEAIYLSYLKSQENALCTSVAASAVLSQLLTMGYTQAEAEAYLQTGPGQNAVAQAVREMTEEQKGQIISAAAANLSEAQKEQIKAGAASSLTDEQKSQIKSAYIGNLMSSEEVTERIAAAVSEANTAAAEAIKLIGQLDNYSLFYNGIIEYTSAVSNAAGGASELKINMDSLYSNVGALKVSVGGLSGAIEALYDGTEQLKEGTGTFAEEMKTADTEISGQIDSMISSVSGSGEEVISFVSEKNTNVSSVQFVIQTEAIKLPKQDADAPKQQEKLSFWQKLLSLFGL